MFPLLDPGFGTDSTATTPHEADEKIWNTYSPPCPTQQAPTELRDVPRSPVVHGMESGLWQQSTGPN
jgi:hypothetical protein